MKIAKRAISTLADAGIAKTHIFCYTDNSLGQSFWTAMGWEKRDDVYVFSCMNKGTTD